MKLVKLILKDFKAFPKATFNLGSPITLIVGPNSSGKSSIIKALLAIKQSLISSNEGEAISSFGEYVDLGIFTDYSHNHNRDAEITIGFEIDLMDKSNPTSQFLYVFFSDLNINKFSIIYHFDNDYSSDQARVKFIEYFLEGPNFKGLSFSIERKKTRSSYKFSAPEKFINYFKNSGYGEGLFDETDYSAAINAEIGLRYNSKLKFTINNKHEDNILTWLYDISDSMTAAIDLSINKQLYYLGPLRKSPSRSYIKTSQNTVVGPTGEFTPSVLANLDRRSKKATTGNSLLRTNQDLFHSWVNKVFPNNRVEAETYEELVKLKVITTTNSPTSRKDNISDVGFGLSQAIPILAQSAVMEPGATLIIEQPELHLHPMAQHALANAIAEAARYNRRFIIETHSEHFIRGLQLAVSKNALNENEGISSLDINTIYIQKSPARILELPIQKNGDYRDKWPTGFFDESYKIAYQHMLNKSKMAE